MKKIIAVLLIIAVLAAIFVFSRRCGSGDKAQEKLILTENQLEPFLNIRGWKAKRRNLRLRNDTRKL